MNWKPLVTGAVLGAIAALAALYYQGYLDRFINPVIVEEQDRTLDQYAFPTLRRTEFKPSNIEIAEENFVEDSPVITRQFYFKVHDKTVSGLMNVPQEPGEYPVLIMLRGYVDQAIYQPGIGTQRGGVFFAENDFITIAPDFLGYGESDIHSSDSFEARFQTYTTVLTLLSSIENFNDALQQAGVDARLDLSRIGMWAHSNGGQIALSVLEITGADYPTTLWAPVTQKFPESILYYADEAPDGGEYLRGITADFLKKYNPNYYSPTQYLHWIHAPIQIHQGTADDAIPVDWSDSFVEEMEGYRKDINYFVYPGEDHNFAQGSWTTLVARDLNFYLDNL